MKKTTIATIAVVVLIAALVCGVSAYMIQNGPVTTQQQQTDSDEPDCDLDDLIERDTDCGFRASQKPKPKPAPTRAAPTRGAPLPKRTR